jgi:hypothetical protein
VVPSSKNVEFYSKNKFEKLVCLVGFIVRIHLVDSRNGGVSQLIHNVGFRCRRVVSIKPQLLYSVGITRSAP